jgi:hypothetical protein
VIEQLPSEVFIRWIILLSRVFPTYRPTARQVKSPQFKRVKNDDAPQRILIAFV